MIRAGNGRGSNPKIKGKNTGPTIDAFLPAAVSATTEGLGLQGVGEGENGEGEEIGTGGE